MAVGYTTGSGTNTTTLAETWNGTNWSVPAAPNTVSAQNVLSGVSCTSQSFCIAVGNSSNGTTAKTLVERWNGSSWVILKSPNVGSASSTLAGVSCDPGYLGISFCVAVGASGSGPTGGNGLIERFYNGSTWTIGSSSTVGGFESVSCVFLSSFCMVGTTTGISRWNGSSVTALAIPAPGPSFHPDFPGISCIGASFCAAAERLSGPSPAAEHSTELTWNGTAWSLPSGAVSSAGGLIGASCATTTFCALVGASNVAALDGPVAVVGS
jgi:hypothetical protein